MCYLTVDFQTIRVVSWYEYGSSHYISLQKLHSFNIHDHRIKTRRLYPNERYVDMLNFPKYFPHINYTFFQDLQESRFQALWRLTPCNSDAMYIVTAHCRCCSFHHLSRWVIDLLFYRTQLWQS
jgi:hypothetical protein